MGAWGQMPDGTEIHIDFAVKKNWKKVLTEWMEEKK